MPSDGISIEEEDGLGCVIFSLPLENCFMTLVMLKQMLSPLE